MIEGLVVCRLHEVRQLGAFCELLFGGRIPEYEKDPDTCIVLWIN